MVMIVVVSTENFGDFKGFPVLNAFQETLILDTVCMPWHYIILKTGVIKNV